jgi:DNA polymerase I-like protein with 3'-5' exonuclease and polymerase domains
MMNYALILKVKTDTIAIKEKMEHCLDDVPMKVPSKVDIAIGNNWGDAS